MRAAVRRAIGWVAIYALAAHTLLTGFGPALTAAPASFDPLAVTCLHAAVPDNPAPPDRTPAQTCDHCILCSATAAPIMPFDVVVGNFAPARVLQLLRPASLAPTSGVISQPNLARGPPPTA